MKTWLLQILWSYHYSVLHVLSKDGFAVYRDYCVIFTMTHNVLPDRIGTVTLGSNFTVRIFCQVSFCRCKISGLELIY